jgi:hypothetical protein
MPEVVNMLMKKPIKYGAPAAISKPIMPPVSIAVAQTLALALVSAPMTWPAPYIMPPRIIIVNAIIGTAVFICVHSWLNELVIFTLPVLLAAARALKNINATNIPNHIFISLTPLTVVYPLPGLIFKLFYP